MTRPQIAIIIGSTRQGRFGDRPATWLHALGTQRPDLGFEIVDLRNYPLPFFDEVTAPAAAPPNNEVALRWAAKLATCDGFIFVTAEYNHGVPAVLKNALDYAYKEFNRKPAAFVGYGGVGAARAVQQLRLTAAGLQMVPLARAVHINMPEYVGVLQQGKAFDEFPHLVSAAAAMLDDLQWWATALKGAREPRHET
ncbi:MAG TPA: NAD(P)H-dependent oxidoreductase [Burkholderiaceae bacterium]|nr:NAD(P)H-dependent oxidoreductase [Burkholderiaceae bacterium]